MKYLQETTGKLRQHKIHSISTIDEQLIAEILIYNEGIDGNYIIEVFTKIFDEAIEYLSKLPEFKDFKIIEEK